MIQCHLKRADLLITVNTISSCTHRPSHRITTLSYMHYSDKLSFAINAPSVNSIMNLLQLVVCMSWEQNLCLCSISKAIVKYTLCKLTAVIKCLFCPVLVL